MATHFLFRLVETVISDDFPTRSGKQIIYLLDSKSDQIYCGNGEKNEPVCFSDKFYVENIHLSLGGNTSFAIRP